MTTKEFMQKIESGAAKVLTLEAARELKGKHILYMYFGFSPSKVAEMTIGDIVSEYELASRKPMEGYDSRADYWEKKCPKYANESKEKLVLLNADGEDRDHIYCHGDSTKWFDVPTFTCSDADREVYYMATESEKAEGGAVERYTFEKSANGYIVTDAKTGVVAIVDPSGLTGSPIVETSVPDALKSKGAAGVARIMREIGEAVSEFLSLNGFPEEGRQ